MVSIEQELQDFFIKHSCDVIWVGLSGGVDSVVLLQALKQCNPNHIIKAIHINHQLQTSADEWQQLCEELCKKLAVEFISVTVDLDRQSSESIEAQAREARYRVFRQFIKKNHCLCTAHHENDQAETFLLQLMRGAGLTGLQALLPWQAFVEGYLARPLLNISRQTIEEYARLHQLQWVSDPMNESLEYDRNYIRHQVLPVLQRRWPVAHKKIAQSARLLQEANHILEINVSQNYQVVHEGNELLIDRLMQLPLEQIKMVLRYWIKVHGFLLPSEKKLQHVIEDVIKARRDANPLVTWKGAEVRRFKNKLFIMQPLSPIDHDLVVKWSNFPEPLMLPNGLGVVSVDEILPIPPLRKEGVPLFCKEGLGEISLHFRQGGEQVKVRDHHRPLKKILQESDIPTWQRERCLLLYCDHEVCGLVVMPK